MVASAFSGRLSMLGSGNLTKLIRGCKFRGSFGRRSMFLGVDTTTKIIYGVTFKIMTPYDLKFIKVTHYIKKFN